MAKQRTIKFPPKRGQLTIRQIEQAVDKVIQNRRAQEAINSPANKRSYTRTRKNLTGRLENGTE